ncbi:hypothetical protein [Streptomyces sp. MB09-02B]|uniref:hypothetical protein n=1 Tax=Streptomyces sp. MB09-02B TaxID=3028667 RepID=UPI0029A8B76F|nr:hypothetical protein [Streptomyces sp. MB09-02B]MDX3643170.1 hypothetical protein [Streptomyces sp. MB09-02B]
MNERQLQVLRWVGQGCPEGIWRGEAHKLSCQALQSRGLVKVSRGKGHWSAALTTAGQHFLDHGSHPPDKSRATDTAPVRKSATQPTAASGRKKAGDQVATPPSPRPSSPNCGPRKGKKTVTEQLLEELAEAGGRIVKREATGRETEKWPIRVAAARRSRKIPKTKELHGGWCRDGYEIRLVDTPAWRLATLTPIPVPARLVQPHPVVKALQGLSHPMGLTKSVQNRAFRLIHALLTATQKAGHTAAIGNANTAPLPHRRRSGPPHFTITAQGQTCELRILQEQDRVEHVPTQKELADAQKYSWVRIPRHDHSPTDRLRICVSGGLHHRAGEWADTAARALEDQLAEIVQEIGLRGQAAERKRLADLEEAQQKRLRWEAAKRQARTEYAEAYRVRHLEAQHAAWQRASSSTSAHSDFTQKVCRPGRPGRKPTHGSRGPRATCNA